MESAVQTLDSETMYEELKRVFADAIGKGTSSAAIFIQYSEKGRIWTVIGVPYEVGDTLEIGPYFKNILLPPPRDYHEKKKEIPINAIIRFKRIELSDLV